MNNRLIASLVALALLVAGLLAWYVSTLETRTVNYVTPARNAAAYNPLFVLQQALQEQGLEVSSHRYFGTIEQPLMPGDTVVMLADGRQLSSRQARQLAAAVEQGLHLTRLQFHHAVTSAREIAELVIAEAQVFGIAQAEALLPHSVAVARDEIAGVGSEIQMIRKKGVNCTGAG